MIAFIGTLSAVYRMITGRTEGDLVFCAALSARLHRTSPPLLGGGYVLITDSRNLLFKEGFPVNSEPGLDDMPEKAAGKNNISIKNPAKCRIFY